MQITPMNEVSAKQVALIDKLCFSHPWSLDDLLNKVNCENACFLTAEENGNILGYIGMQTILDEGDIYNVAVLPQFRRQGIADTLLFNLCEYAKNKELSFITLEVRESNIAAISLYKKYSFEEVGRRKNYYSSPKEDAILMTKHFNNGE